MVEQRTENPRVPSSILGLGTMKPGGSGSAVEHLLAKEKVASSNLVFRSIFISDCLSSPAGWSSPTRYPETLSKSRFYLSILSPQPR